MAIYESTQDAIATIEEMIKLHDKNLRVLKQSKSLEGRKFMLNFKASKKFKVAILLLLFFFVFSISLGGVLADNMTGDIVLESGQTLEKTSFLSGNKIRIDGDINGTAFVAGSSIEVNGNIDGDLFVAGQDIIINGTITGSLITASQNVTINGLVENNIYIAGSKLNVKSITNGSAFLAGQDVYIEDGATIGRDAFIGASKVYQNGAIKGDLSSSSDTLFVTGKIGGDLNYRSNNKADFSGNSEVTGDTNWKKIEPRNTVSASPSWTIIKLIFWTLAALAVWGFVRLIRKDFWINLANEISASPLKTLGYGALTVILIPILSVFLMITIIGIPLSLILLALYVIAIYISKIILAIFISIWVQKRYNWSNAQAFWLFLLGLIILLALEVIPVIGWIFSLIIISFGLGSIVLSIKNSHNLVKY